MKTFIDNLQPLSMELVVMYSGDELYALLNNLDNKRLLYIYDQSKFLYFANDTKKWNQNFLYFICWKGMDITGVAKCKINTSYDQEKVLELLYLEVAPKDQNKGFASHIAKKIFDFCKRSNYVFKTSQYTKIGLQKLKPLFLKLSNELKMPFIDLDVTDQVQVNFEYLDFHKSKMINHFF